MSHPTMIWPPPPVTGQCKVIAQIGQEIKQQWITVVPKSISLFGRSWMKAFNVGLQRLCINPRDRKLHDCRNTITEFRPYVRREARNCNAKKMHAPMQGKEKETYGKDEMQWNGRCISYITHSKVPESTVRKGFTLQNGKQSKADIEKDWRKSKPKQEANVKDQADLSCKSRNQDTRDTVAKSNRRDFVVKDKAPKGFGIAPKEAFDRYLRAIKAFTDCDEAHQSQARSGNFSIVLFPDCQVNAISKKPLK